MNEGNNSGLWAAGAIALAVGTYMFATRDGGRGGFGGGNGGVQFVQQPQPVVIQGGMQYGYGNGAATYNEFQGGRDSEKLDSIIRGQAELKAENRDRAIKEEIARSAAETKFYVESYNKGVDADVKFLTKEFEQTLKPREINGGFVYGGNVTPVNPIYPEGRGNITIENNLDTGAGSAGTTETTSTNTVAA